MKYTDEELQDLARDHSTKVREDRLVQILYTIAGAVWRKSPRNGQREDELQIMVMGLWKAVKGKTWEARGNCKYTSFLTLVAVNDLAHAREIHRDRHLAIVPLTHSTNTKPQEPTDLLETHDDFLKVQRFLKPKDLAMLWSRFALSNRVNKVTKEFGYSETHTSKHLKELTQRVREFLPELGKDK